VKILVDVALSDTQLSRIREASRQATIVVATDPAQMNQQVRDADVVFGSTSARVTE